MAGAKRTLDGKQRLAPLVARLRARGTELVDENGMNFLQGWGFLGAVIGLFLILTGGLGLVAPEVAANFPGCRGDPRQNFPAGILLFAGGFAMLTMSRRLPKRILLTDTKMVLAYANGRERAIAWHEVVDTSNWVGGWRMLTLSTGHIVVLRHGNFPAWHDFTLLITFRQWLGEAISPGRPSLSSALEKFKLQLLGPGVQVPPEQSLPNMHVQTATQIFPFVFLAALIFSVLGWLSGIGAMLGLFPVAVSLIGWYALRGQGKDNDRIVVRKDRIEIKRRHFEDQHVALADTRRWNVTDDGLSITFLDKRPSVVVNGNWRNFAMLVEAARIASQLGPIGHMVVDNTRRDVA